MTYSEMSIAAIRAANAVYLLGFCVCLCIFFEF
jgi:hypothetical protein